MSEENNNRTNWLHLRLKPEEYAKMHKLYSKSTCRKMSDYARKILLDKPITAIYRNKSLDDLITEAIKLRNELNGIGNNFNQAVKKLHTLHQIAEFRGWIITYKLEKKIILNKIDEIKNHIQKVAEKWLQ